LISASSRRKQIVTLASKYAVPAMYDTPEFTATGGLMSYGPSLIEMYRHNSQPPPGRAGEEP